MIIWKISTKEREISVSKKKCNCSEQVEALVAETVRTCADKSPAREEICVLTELLIAGLFEFCYTIFIIYMRKEYFLMFRRNKI